MVSGPGRGGRPRAAHQLHPFQRMRMLLLVRPILSPHRHRCGRADGAVRLPRKAVGERAAPTRPRKNPVAPGWIHRLVCLAWRRVIEALAHVGSPRPTKHTPAPGCNCCHRDRDVADQPEQPSVGGRVERRDAPLEELIAGQLRGRPSKHHPTDRSSSNRDQATGSRAASTTTRHDPGEEENRTRLSATSSNPARSSAGLWRRRSGQGRRALQPHRARSHKSRPRPRRRPLLRRRGRSPDRAARVNPVSEADGPQRVRGRAHPTTNPPMNAGQAFGVTDPHPTTPTTTQGERPMVARWAARPRRRRRNAGESRGEATETVLAPPGKAWRDPMALLVAGRAVCRFCCRTIGDLGQLGRSGSSRQPCRRTNVPSRDWRNRHWSRGRTRRDRMGAGQVVPRYDPRSVSWGRNPDQAAR
jgi:hypothetical protein